MWGNDEFALTKVKSPKYKQLFKTLCSHLNKKIDSLSVARLYLLGYNPKGTVPGLLIWPMSCRPTIHIFILLQIQHNTISHVGLFVINVILNKRNVSLWDSTQDKYEAEEKNVHVSSVLHYIPSQIWFNTWPSDHSLNFKLKTDTNDH